MAGLLVSVRSAEEADAAVAGGAGLIDVKEPSRGPLGRPDAATLAAVLRQVGGRRPVSAAWGELAEHVPFHSLSGLAFVKVGLAGYHDGWRQALRSVHERLRNESSDCGLVAVAYADWKRAAAPAPEAVCSFAVEEGCAAFLLDTWGKDGSGLLDWLSVPQVVRLASQCRAAGTATAVAGSLGAAQIQALRAVLPDWFAVRGAACQGNRREAGIDRQAVAELVRLVARLDAESPSSSTQVHGPDRQVTR